MRLERPTAMILVGIIGVGIGIGGGYFGFRFQNVEAELRDARLSSEDFEDLQSSVEGLVVERDSLAMRVQELVEEVEDLNANETQSTERNQLLESRVSILESQLEEIPVLMSQLEDREFQLLEKEQIIDELNRIVDNLKEQVNDVERELANVLRKEGRSVPDPGFSLLFEESFEYVDSISNNGWIPVSVAGTEETQSFVSSDQNNALRLDDNNSAVGFEFHYPIDLIERDFRVDYYVRIGTFSDELGMDLRGSEGIADGVRGISTGFNGVNFVVQNRIYFVYDRDQWYHIRLDLNMTEKSMDVFVDDMEIPLDSDLSFTDVYYDRLIIRTSAVGVGDSFWDGIRLQMPDPASGEISFGTECIPFCVFSDGFEYSDSITNHGWVYYRGSGQERTQSTIVAEGNRALNLIDEGDRALIYRHPIPPQNGEVTVDYYLRAEQSGQGVGVSLWTSSTIGDPINMINGELSETNRFRLLTQSEDNFYFTYNLKQWYHIRLVIRTGQQNLDVYVNDMVNPLDSNVEFLGSFFDSVQIGTTATTTGEGYLDGIAIRSTAEPSSPEGTAVFVDSFEYSDAPSNHGWVMAQGVGSLQTQRGVSIDGSRALQFSDTSENNPLEISHTFPQLSGDFQVDYYLRTTDYLLNVQLLLDDGEGEIPGNGRGIATELTDHPSRAFRVQNIFTDVTYNLDQWYHIRLVVRPNEQNFDVYFDDMSNPLLTSIGFQVNFFNRIRILTGTGGTGLGYWDGIVIQDLSTNSTSGTGVEIPMDPGTRDLEEPVAGTNHLGNGGFVLLPVDMAVHKVGGQATIRGHVIHEMPVGTN